MPITLRRTIAVAALVVAASDIGSSVAAGAAGTKKQRVCLVRVIDETGRLRARRVRRALRRALRESPNLTLVSARRWARQAQRARIPRRRWFRQESLRRIGSRLSLDIVLVARLRRKRRRYRVLISARSVDDGKLLVRRSFELRRARVSRAHARRIVAALRQGIAPPQRAPEPVAKIPAPAWVAGPASRPAPGDHSAPLGRRAGANSNAVPNLWGPSSRPSQGDDGWSGTEQGWEPIEPAVTKPSSGGDIKEGRAIKAMGSTFTPRLGGRVSVEHHSYLADAGQGKVAGRNSVDLAIEAAVQSKAVSVLGRLLVRHDFSDDTRDRLEAEEVTIDLQLTSWLSIRAGRAIVAWGTANSVNPADVINGTDLRDPLDPERRGSWMVRLGALAGPVLVEAFYLPVPESHLLPMAEKIDVDGTLFGRSRWLLPAIAIDPTNPPTQIAIAPGSAPATALGNTQAALRLATSIGRLDFAAGYAWRFDPMPTLQTEQQDGALRLSFEHQRVHQITIEAEAAFGKLRLAGEAMATLSADLQGKDDAVTDPYVFGVVGADYRSAQFFGEHRLHLFCDFWLTRSLVDSSDSDSEDLLGLLRRPFTYAGFGRIRYEVGESLRFDLDLLCALDRYDLMIRPSIQYVAFDRATIELGATILRGDQLSGYFGRFRDNTRVSARVEVSF